MPGLGWARLRNERGGHSQGKAFICVCFVCVCVHSALCMDGCWAFVRCHNTQQNEGNGRNCGVGSGLCEGMCGCSTGRMSWVFSVLWIPGSVPVDLLARGCCHARHSQVVLVAIPVVPGQLW